MLIASIASIPSAFASNNAYDSGYNHGCDDADISDPDDRYINQPERGPSFHTGAFMDGYNAGFDSCSSSNDGDIDDNDNENGNDDNDNDGGSSSNGGLVNRVCEFARENTLTLELARKSVGTATRSGRNSKCSMFIG